MLISQTNENACLRCGIIRLRCQTQIDSIQFEMIMHVFPDQFPCWFGQCKYYMKVNTCITLSLNHFVCIPFRLNVHMRISLKCSTRMVHFNNFSICSSFDMFSAHLKGVKYIYIQTHNVYAFVLTKNLDWTTKKKKKLERNGKWRKIEIDSKHSQCLQIDWSGGWNISKKQLKLHETKRYGTVKRTAKQTHSEQWETYGGMKNYTKITLTIYKTRFRVNERGGRGEKNELSFARICENKCHTQSQNEKQSTIIAHSTANLRFAYE